MGLRITVNTKVQKPYTCVLDGLQCSTFATFGKGNLLFEGNSRNDILVRAQRGKRIVEYRMSPYAWDICLYTEDLHRAARRILRASIPQIWLRDDKDTHD